jgi:hypothetical protein
MEEKMGLQLPENLLERISPAPTPSLILPMEEENLD